MTNDQTERLIKERVDQAIQRALPQLLINFFHYNNATVQGAKEIENSPNQRITEVNLASKALVFRKFKVREDPIETYKHDYWAYELMSDGRLVFGIEVKNHWAGGKPELKEITAYVPGTWEEQFKEIKAKCDALTEQHAKVATAEKRQKKQQQLKDRMARFGLDNSSK